MLNRSSKIQCFFIQWNRITVLQCYDPLTLLFCGAFGLFLFGVLGKALFLLLIQSQNTE